MKKSLSSKMLCEKIKPFTSNLPTQTLAFYIQTNDLLQEWLKTRYEALLFGESLKARFMKGGGNPAKRAFKAGYLDKFGYEVHMASVSVCASEFALYQIAWEEISDTFKHFDGSPKDEVELLFDGLKQHYDDKFLHRVKGGNWSIKEFEKRMKLLRDILRKYQNNRSWIGELSEEDNEAIIKVLFDDKFNPKDIQINPTWGHLAFNICAEAAKQDKAILRALKQYYSDFLWLLSLNVDICQKQRKTKPRYVWSKKWNNGNQYLRTNSGYKPVADVEVKVLPMPELLKNSI